MIFCSINLSFLESILNNLILSKNHIDTVKIRFKTNIKKKDKLLNFLRSHFVQNFSLYNISRFGNGDFSILKAKNRNGM